MILECKVTPNASKNEILRWEGDCLFIKIQGVPEKGKVNEKLMEFLSVKLKIAKSRIRLLSGHTSRFKKLDVEGISDDDMKERLSRLEK